MDFTGTSLVLKRNIYPQTGNYSFSIDCVVDNTTGKYFFGLSGNGNNIEFKMQSGKIYFNDLFIHSYRSNEVFSIDANFTNTKSNIIKNDVGLLFGYPKPTGYFDYFYFKRENNGLGASFDLNISGDSFPSYIIEQNGYLLSSGQLGVTGRFVNLSNFPINIFDSNIQTSQPYQFGKIQNSINPFATGKFIYSGDFTTIDFSQPIFTTFNTNFGDYLVLFTITNLSAVDGFVFLQPIDDFSLDTGNNLNLDVNYLNFSGGIATTGFNTSLIFVLDYISGSGNFTVSGQNFDKDFTGLWRTYTGVDSLSLFPMPVVANSAKTRITGGGIFDPNTFISFQLSHIESGTNSDAARLTISGQLVYNPISTIINIQNNKI